MAPLKFRQGQRVRTIHTPRDAFPWLKDIPVELCDARREGTVIKHLEVTWSTNGEQQESMLIHFDGDASPIEYFASLLEAIPDDE